MCVCFVGGDGNVKLLFNDQTFTFHVEVQKLHRVSIIKYVKAPKCTDENVIIKHLIPKYREPNAAEW